MPRNSSGTMSLPAPGVPFQSGTTISSSQVNATFSDLAAEISDSLSRSGKGGMTASVRAPDGTVGAPAYSFTSEVGTGAYRAGAGDLRISVSGVDALKLAAGGISGNVTLMTVNAGVVSTGANSAQFLRGNLTATDPGADVVMQSTATRTAGSIAAVQNPPGTNKLLVDYQGLLQLAAPAAAIQPASLWTAIVPTANWTADNGLAYWKDACGMVHMKGTLTPAVGFGVPFTFPVGFRPAFVRAISMADNGAAATGFVNPDGTISTTAFTAAHLYYMDDASFLAEQ